MTDSQHPNMNEQAGRLSGSRRPRRRKRRVTRMVLASLLIAIPVAWWYWTSRPERLFAEADKLLPTDPDSAAQLLEESVRLSGGDYPQAQILWTRALVRSRRLPEALGCFSQIALPSETSHEELVTLADESIRYGLPLLASMALNAVPVESPFRGEAVERLIGISQQFGQLETAHNLAQELARLKPSDPQPWLRIAQLREQLMDPIGAATACEESLTREQSSERRLPALRLLTRLRIVLGEREAARRFQNEINAAAKTRTPEDRLQEALLWRMEGDSAAAWEEVSSLLSDDPQNHAALELRGTLAMDRRDWNTAAGDFRNLVQQQAWNKNAHYRLALSLQHLERAEEARQHFDINRRLTETSLRILKIRSSPDAGSLERLRELQSAYAELGQHQLAAAIGQQIQRQIERQGPE